MWQKIREWWNHEKHSRNLIVLFVLVILVYLLPDILYSVRSGEAAVMWKMFGGGTVVDKVYREGLHAKWPWDRVHIYNIRLQEQGKEFDVLSADGLHVEVEVSVRYRPIENYLGQLHRNVGPDFVKTLLLPTIGALAREEMGKYKPSELYSEKRSRVEEEILRRLRAEAPVRYLFEGKPHNALHIENVFVRSIKLPEVVEKAINEKLAQRHKMLEYDYRIEKEAKEKERKRIEAEGIRVFQDTISEGISEKYLQWKGIDATLELAQSDNSKVVIIGAGDSGLPIILGGLESPPVEDKAAGNDGAQNGDGTPGASTAVRQTSTVRQE